MSRRSMVIWCALFFCVLAFSATQVWIFSHQTYLLTGTTIEEDTSEENYVKVQGATVNIYRVKFSDYRAFEKLLTLREIQQDAYKLPREQNCFNMFGSLAGILTDQPRGDKSEFGSIQEYRAKYAGDAIAMSDTNGEFSIRLKRGHYVLLVQKTQTHV